MSQVSEITVSWTPITSGRVQAIQIQSRIKNVETDPEAGWTEQAAAMNPAAGSFKFTSNVPGARVEVRMRSRMEDGVYSPWVYDDILSVDVEDVFIQDTPPNNPLVGDLWVDTSVNPTVTRAWNGTAWVLSATVGATPSNLVLGSGVNAVRDPTFLDPGYWTNLVTATNGTATTALGVTRAAVIEGDGVRTGGNTTVDTLSMACVGGERIQVGCSGYVSTALTGTASTRVVVTNRAGVETSITIDTFPATTGAVTNVTGNIILPDDAVSYKFRLYVNWTTGVVRAGRIFFAKPYVINLTKIGSNLILDDGRTATEIDLVNSQRQYNSRFNLNMDSIADFVGFSSTLSTSGGVMRMTATAADPYFFTGPINLPGSQIPVISIRARPLAPNPSFDGRVYYFTSGHGDSASYYGRCPRPALTQNQWVILEFDMTKLTQGGSDWINSTIQKIRVDLAALAEDWEVDYIDFGAYVPAGSAIGGATAAAVAAATQTIGQIVLDTILSRVEKPALIIEVARIDSSYAALLARATAMGVVTSTITPKYDALKNYLNNTIPTWNNTAIDTTIVQSAFQTAFTDFYAQEVAVASAIDAKAGTTADWDGITGQGKTDLINQAAASAATIATFVADSKLSPVEKPGVIRENNRIAQNWGKLSAQAANQGVSHTAIDNAYQALQDYLEAIAPTGTWDDVTVTNTIVATTFQNKFNAYCTAEANLASALLASSASTAGWDGIYGNGKPMDNSTVNTPGDHMVLNASFSAPLDASGKMPHWTVEASYAGTVSRQSIGTDLWCARFDGSSSIRSNPIPISAGERLYWRLQYRIVLGRGGTANASDTATPWALIRFYDQAGNWLDTADATILNNAPQSPGSSLNTFTGTVVAPANARIARAYFTLDVAPPIASSLARAYCANIDFDRTQFGATLGAQSGSNFYAADGTTLLNDASIITSLGQAATIAGQTGWATYATVTPANMNNRTQYLNTSGYFSTHRGMATNLISGLTNNVSAVPTATDQGSGTGVTVTIPAHNRTFAGASGLETVAYNAGTIANLAYNTLYYIYCDDPTRAGGAVTYAATGNPDGMVRIGRLWLRTITTPSNGGPPTSGGGGGGGGYCVAADSFMPTDARAIDVLAGDRILALDYGTMTSTRLVEVTGNVPATEPCVRISSASGITLVASISTPVTLRSGEMISIMDVLGHEVPVEDRDGFRWEAITAIEQVAPRRVARISCHGATYAAGEQHGAYIFTHNPAKP